MGARAWLGARAWGGGQRSNVASAIQGVSGGGGIGGGNDAAGQTARLARRQEMLDVINRRTGQRSSDIRESGQVQSAGIRSNLARLGMGGTTVGASLQAGVERGTQAELRREADSGVGDRLSVLGQSAAFQEQAGAQSGEFASRIAAAKISALGQLGVAGISSRPSLMESQRKERFDQRFQIAMRGRR